MKLFKIKSRILVLTGLLIIGTAYAQRPAPARSSGPVDASAPFDSVSFFKTFKSAFATANGIQMHYVIGGTGKQVVVLLHGFPSDWYSWRKIMPVLAKEYTVIAPDLRGLGLSDKPKTGYSKKNMAEDVHGLVHQLGYKDIYIAGYDFGGPVSFAYTCEYPDDVKKLVMFECGGVAGFGLEKLMALLMGDYGILDFSCSPFFPRCLSKDGKTNFSRHLHLALS